MHTEHPKRAHWASKACTSPHWRYLQLHGLYNAAWWQDVLDFVAQALQGHGQVHEQMRKGLHEWVHK